MPERILVPRSHAASAVRHILCSSLRIQRDTPLSEMIAIVRRLRTIVNEDMRAIASVGGQLIRVTLDSPITRCHNKCTPIVPATGVKARVLVAILALWSSAWLARTVLADPPPAASPGSFVYTPGEGLQLGHGLAVRAFVTLEVLKPEGRTSIVTPDTFTLFTVWNSLHWHFFAETDLNRIVIANDHGEITTGDDSSVELARLYLEYTPSDLLNVRVGKFLTPIGIWNPIHEAPYLPTVSDPLAASDRFFDNFATGILVFGRTTVDSVDVDYSLYGQPTDQLLAAPDITDRKARRGAGARVELSTDTNWTLGLSALALDNKTSGQWEQVAGADARWHRQDFELWSEFVTNTPLDSGRMTWAWYAQATMPIHSGVFGVARYEHAQLAAGDVNHGIVGLNYQPWPWLVLKTQYLFSDRESLSRADAHAPTEQAAEGDHPGFAASFSVIF
jgi:hypothetical protein